MDHYALMLQLPKDKSFMQLFDILLLDLDKQPKNKYKKQKHLNLILLKLIFSVELLNAICCNFIFSFCNRTDEKYVFTKTSLTLAKNI